MPADASYSDVIVPTIDTKRNIDIVLKLIESRQHVMIVGVTGTGKTAIVSSLLATQLESDFTYFSMNFSAQTSSKKV